MRLAVQGFFRLSDLDCMEQHPDVSKPVGCGGLRYEALQRALM
jgi:hypothetical protein